MLPSFSFFRWLAPLSALVLLGAGCFGGSSSSSLDGGVFWTRNQGAEWSQLVTLNLGKSIGSIANVGTVSSAADPQDPNGIYVGTTENGLLYTLDGGDVWLNPKDLSVGQVNEIAPDPKQLCTVYAVRANQILKTETCHREWHQIFFDPRTDIVFTALAVDWFNPRNVYAATSEGDIFRTDDGGASWRVIYREEGVTINDITISPHDSRLVYVATEGVGILKSTDAGATWQKIVDVFAEYDRGSYPRTVVVDPKNANTIYHISRHGILQSTDSGTSWRSLTLPTPPGTVEIRTMAVHPKNSKQLVYATDTSIVFSDDGGATWKPKKLPTSRGVSFILYDTSNNPGLYLGTVSRRR